MGILNQVGNLGKKPTYGNISESRLYKLAIQNAKDELFQLANDEQILLMLRYLGFNDNSIVRWGETLFKILKIVQKSNKLTRDLRLMLKAHNGDFDKVKGIFLQLLDKNSGLSENDIKTLESIIKDKGNN